MVTSNPVSIMDTPAISETQRLDVQVVHIALGSCQIDRHPRDRLWARLSVLYVSNRRVGASKKFNYGFLWDHWLYLTEETLCSVVQEKSTLLSRPCGRLQSVCLCVDATIKLWTMLCRTWCLEHKNIMILANQQHLSLPPVRCGENIINRK